MVAQNTSTTEFLAIAEAEAGELQYLRAHIDENRTISLDAKDPWRGMTISPGTSDGVYWVSTHVWSESDLPKGCSDLLAVHNALRQAFPSAQFMIDAIACAGFGQQGPRKS